MLSTFNKPEPITDSLDTSAVIRLTPTTTKVKPLELSVLGFALTYVPIFIII